MKWMYIFAVGILVYPTSSFSHDACGEMADTATMRACINNDLSAADAQLNTLYNELVGKLRHWDRMDDAATTSLTDRLRRSQRAWIAFRDAECAFRGSSMEGGSAQPLIENGCRAALTTERNMHLRDLLDMF